MDAVRCLYGHGVADAVGGDLVGVHGGLPGCTALQFGADVLHSQVHQRGVVREQAVVAAEHAVEDGVGDAVLGEVGLVDEVRLGVVGEHVAEGDAGLQRHGVQRRGQAGGGGVVLADAAAALGAAGVEPVVLVDLLGDVPGVVEDVHRVAGDRGGVADRALFGVAGVVGGDPADALVGEGGGEVGVVVGLLRQDPQSRVLAGDQLVGLQGKSADPSPDAVVGDLVVDGAPADPLGAAVGVGPALPGHHGDVLFAAEEGVRVGVVDPAELVAVGDQLVGERVDAVVVLALVHAAGSVVDEVEGEMVALLPGGGVVDVGGGHADRVRCSGPVGAVDVAGCAVEPGVPAVVGGEHVVHVDGEVVAGGAEVHTAGHPFHDAPGQQPELLLVLVADEGDDQLAPPVVPVLADQ